MCPYLVKFRAFGKILKNIWPFLFGLYSIWQNIQPSLAILKAIGQILILVNVQIFNTLGHTGHSLLEQHSF